MNVIVEIGEMKINERLLAGGECDCVNVKKMVK